MIKVLIFLLLQQAEKVRATWSVTFENPDHCALKGTSVEFKCSYSYPEDESVRETAWFKGMLEDDTWKREDDTGHYYFWFDTNKYGRRSKKSVHLSVTELKASIRPIRVRAGDRVTLECTTTCQNHRTIWFRDGRRVMELEFHAQTEHAGNYSCTIEGLNSLQSDPVALDVLYSPLNVSIEVSGSGPLLVGSSVTLTCRSAANPAADTFTWWYRRDVSNSSLQLQEGSGQVLSISSVELTHTGAYICQAGNPMGQSRSAQVLLTVEDTGGTAGGVKAFTFLDVFFIYLD
ncbi:B-cell receptor CD22 [Fundulus heteroclitus]|uniref:B-cell receptor CD22 n=1 Tax=Fundulus heteroclitus TaxID=8078 RepID=UPI00165B0DF5|nr:B-cell receptor CD22 [Fundulus heteroclitus]